MNKKFEYKMYVSHLIDSPWYHVYIFKDLIFKVQYTTRGCSVRVLGIKPKDLIRFKYVPPYNVPFGMMKNIMRSYKLSHYKSSFRLVYPLAR